MSLAGNVGPASTVTKPSTNASTNAICVDITTGQSTCLGQTMKRVG
jgi:hypothetical protein